MNKLFLFANRILSYFRAVTFSQSLQSKAISNNHQIYYSMKKIIVVIAMLCTFQFSFSQELTAKLETLISAYARLYKFNGSVLVAKNGAVLLDKGYGYRSAA